MIPLLGKFKNEDGSKLHLMVSVNVTKSGLEVRRWIESWVAVLQKEGRVDGPAFCQMDGSIIKAREVECEMHHQLELIQLSTSDLIDEKINIREKYSLFRSLRRGATARAVDMKVSEASIDLHNRWRARELLKGQRKRSSMRDYYTDLSLVLNARLEFSRIL